MSVTYTLHPDQRLVVTTHAGVVEDAEFIALYRTLYADPKYEVGMDEIADLRGVTDFRISATALTTVEQLVEERYEGSGVSSRAAIVAPADIPYGVARIYDALAAGGPEEVSVFRDLPPALRWLGIDEAPDELPTDRGVLGSGG